MNAIEREIAAAVAQAARALKAAGVPADVGELEQEGWLEALHEMHRYDPQRGDVGAFLWSVLSKALPRAVARWRYPLSLSDLGARAAPRVELAEADDVADDYAPTPEQLVAEAEARTRVALAVAQALAEMPARAREIAANDLGEPSPVVAARMGVSDRRVREVREDLARRVRIVAAC